MKGIFAWLGSLMTIAIVIAIIGAISYFGGLFGNSVQAHYNKAVINSKVTQQVFNANNKIQSQGYFEGLKADYDGYLVKIKIQPSASAFDKANLLGLRQQCIDAAQTYNAAANSLGQAPFRSADLPFSLDPNACSNN